MRKNYDRPQLTDLGTLRFETVCAGSGQTGACEYGIHTQGSPKPDIGGVCDQCLQRHYPIQWNAEVPNHTSSAAWSAATAKALLTEGYCPAGYPYP